MTMTNEEHQAMKEKGARLYAHRLAADPTSCPVCCDDGEHDDKRFDIGQSREINDFGNTTRRLFRCFCKEAPDPTDTECGCLKGVQMCQYHMDEIARLRVAVDQADPLDGWCNHHQCVHPDDRGQDASPNRHNHLAAPEHPHQWFLDNPDAWVVLRSQEGD